MNIIIKNFSLAQIADSGQCFRMEMQPDKSCVLAARDKALKIIPLGGDEYDFNCTTAQFDGYWKGYFDLEADYQKWMQSVPKSDAFLTKAAEYGKGLRILRQDAWEMLVTFLISQRKNIPAIKKCVNAISEKFGTKIDGTDMYAFPTPQQLASDYALLGTCSLGYRTQYVYEAAVSVCDGTIDLKAMASLDDDALFAQLLKIKGVGAKVANCVMLFGFHRINAFPIDVWIQRILDAHYQAGFPLDAYKGYAGVIQQYMFYYARSEEYAAGM
ncbi:MAG: DNA-3-methyladenine glycosylase 2 [Clostridia bacterium]|jgi:N-glycosylase/DNA lyase|nr:DNA-3-methyladenine glycosylase 2 [Clostridia bacterium]NLS85462.1 DNA glycosylase [Oscillospiraceae bacterium]